MKIKVAKWGTQKKQKKRRRRLSKLQHIPKMTYLIVPSKFDVNATHKWLLK
jgi:hypothetical protein